MEGLGLVVAIVYGTAIIYVIYLLRRATVALETMARRSLKADEAREL